MLSFADDVRHHHPPAVNRSFRRENEMESFLHFHRTLGDFGLLPACALDLGRFENVFLLPVFILADCISLTGGWLGDRLGQTTGLRALDFAGRQSCAACVRSYVLLRAL